MTYDPGPAYRQLTREDERAQEAYERADMIRASAKAMALHFAKHAAEYFARADIDWDIRVKEWSGDKTYVENLAEHFEEDLHEHFDIPMAKGR